MKYKYHFIILGTIVFISIVLVFFYYTQDFTEELNFKNSISYSDIDIQTTTQHNYNDRIDTYISSATANLGKLKLTNNGIFSQRYDLPEFLGCIEVEGSSEPYIEFTVLPDIPYNYHSEYITIQKGQSREFDLIAKYNRRRLYDVTSENMGNIKIFKLPNKEENPLKNDIYSNLYYQKETCSNYINNEIPIKEIQIV